MLSPHELRAAARLFPPTFLGVLGSPRRGCGRSEVGQGVRRAAAPTAEVQPRRSRWVAAVHQKGDLAPCSFPREKTCSDGERGRQAEVMQIDI